MCGCRCGGCCRRLPAGGRELWSGRKIPPPLPFPELGLRGPRGRGDADGEKGSPPGRRERGEGAIGGPAPGSHLLLLCPGITAPPAAARLCSTPTGLRPLGFDAFAPLLSSVPPPAPSSPSAGLCCSSFASGLKGPLLMVGEAGPEVGVGGAQLVPSCLCLLGAPLP